MIAWIKYWFTKPEPQPQPIVQMPVYPRSFIPQHRYTMTPPRLLEWWAKEPQLDPLPKSPKKAQEDLKVRFNVSELDPTRGEDLSVERV